MSRPELDTVHHHDDFDGVVATAMLCAWQGEGLATQAISYADADGWLAQRLPKRTAVVDFLFHPDATVWVDHHATAFRSPVDQAGFTPSAFHVWDVNALSCPAVIVKQSWFHPGLRRRFAAWLHWANMVDGALYASPQAATCLRSPYQRFALSVPRWVHTNEATEVIHTIAFNDIRAVVRLPLIKYAFLAAKEDQREVAKHAKHWTQGPVSRFDQGALVGVTFDRYRPFVLAPECEYTVAIYATKQSWVVSVGSNPWKRPKVAPHLGNLCRRYGGGGRETTAGVTAKSYEEARRIAEAIACSFASEKT